MPMSEHEVALALPTYFSLVDGLPSLWDTLPPEGDCRERAVCLLMENGTVIIHTDPEIVSSFLGAE